jgi:hypothetical protein
MIKLFGGRKKLILVASLFLLVLSEIIFVLLSRESKKNMVNELRVAFPLSYPSKHYDPTRIYIAPEYIFCENIFSPLVEFDSNGRLIGGVADSFEWVGDELFFKIRQGLKTIDGHLIGAEDVVFSLKRLLVLASATHGDLVELLCGGKPLSSINDHCPGIYLKDQNVLVLKTDKPKTFLVPLLASIDFAVIPRASVDKNSLHIIDYKNTSGPYFVEREAEAGAILLKANPHHYHYSMQMPQLVKLVPTQSADESMRLILNNGVDVLTTVDHATPEQIMAVANKNTAFNLHVTMNIRSLLATFTPRGLRELVFDQRIKIAKVIRKFMGAMIQGREGYELALQIFPVFGEAGLSEAQVKQLATLFTDEEEAQPITEELRIRVVRLQPRGEFERVLRRAFPNSKVEFGIGPGFEKFQRPEDEPHISISGPDMGYLEDFSLLSYYMNAGIFGLSRNDANEWLRAYQKIDNKELRIKKLRALHFDTVANLKSVPIAVFPYTAIARKPWQPNLSSLFANNQLWLIRNQ